MDVGPADPVRAEPARRRVAALHREEQRGLRSEVPAAHVPEGFGRGVERLGVAGAQAGGGRGGPTAVVAQGAGGGQEGDGAQGAGPGGQEGNRGRRGRQLVGGAAGQAGLPDRRGVRLARGARGPVEWRSDRARLLQERVLHLEETHELVASDVLDLGPLRGAAPQIPRRRRGRAGGALGDPDPASRGRVQRHPDLAARYPGHAGPVVPLPRRRKVHQSGDRGPRRRHDRPDRQRGQGPEPASGPEGRRPALSRIQGADRFEIQYRAELAQRQQATSRDQRDQREARPAPMM
mmetsp:Transcript_37272/g.112700  ORF Transcript_37272/g.112700 Transcript_37272/m.112700 type:complete len:292 (+) Transcript_37272:212-1087(+)